MALCPLLLVPANTKTKINIVQSSNVIILVINTWKIYKNANTKRQHVKLSLSYCTHGYTHLIHTAMQKLQALKHVHLCSTNNNLNVLVYKGTQIKLTVFGKTLAS